MGTGTKSGLALLAVFGATFAQPAEESWDNLSRLRAGQKIAVVDTKLKSIEGSFIGYSGEAVSLRLEEGEVAIPRSDVLSIKDRQVSHRRRNVLLGLAAGAAGGLVAGAVKGANYHEKGETGVFVMVFTPIGAGIGAAVGAALPAGQVTIYRAKPAKRAVPPPMH